MHDLAETGITLIDRNLAGLMTGRPYLVFGDSGTGKSILGLQFLHAGIARGEPGLLLTLERPDDLLFQAERLGLALGEPLDDGRLVLLEYDRNATSNVLRFGWKPLLERLAPFAGDPGVRRAVFDPIHPLFAGNTEEGRLRYDLRYFVESLEEWGWTTLFLNERGATQGHPSFYRVFSDLCSGVMELQDETENLSSSKHLFVHKLRHPGGPRRKIPFRIVAEQGLVESDEAAPAMEPAAVGSTADGAVASSASPPAAGSLALAPPAQARSAGRRKVLLADDDPFIRKLLERPLRDEFDIITAGDGLEALTTTLRERPDVVVLDVLLPTITGFEVCRSLRESGFDVPILIISGGAIDSNDRLRGLLLGANDYIAKPFNVREVTEKIRTASRYRVDASAARAPAAELDHLVAAARARTVSWEIFQERCERGCRNAGRYQAPMGIVYLRVEETLEVEAWRTALATALEQITRPEDAATLLPSGEGYALLNTEDNRGTIAYLATLRATLAGAPLPAGRVITSYAVFDPRSDEPWTAATALERARAHPADLMRDPRFAGGATARGRDEEAVGTGTDG